MSASPWQLLIVLIMILVFFGAGKLPKVMSQLGTGLKSFKEAMRDDSNNTDKKN